MGFTSYAILILVALVLLLRYSKTARMYGFMVLYRLYAHTFVGQVFHNFLLRQSRENRDEMRNQWFDYLNTSVETIGDDKVYVVPFLSDNFCFIIMIDGDSGKKAIAVDPADPELVKDFLVHHNAQLTHILTTHRHADHSGGNKKLQIWYPEVEIFGGANENVPATTIPVRDAETHDIKLSDNCVYSVTCVETPCHTRGHVCYIVQKQNIKPALLFTGDHVFVGGVGALFEDSPQQMYNSLMKLKTRIEDMFPDYGVTTKNDLLMLCGHEYTLPNLYFASTLEPDNLTIYRKLTWAMAKRNMKLPTVPSPWYDELQCNPFLRTDSDELKQRFSCNDPVQILAMLSEGKVEHRQQQQQHHDHEH
jgi:hydroxyacylglutathione hydrolase